MFLMSRIVPLFITFVFLTQWQSAISLEGNATKESLSDEDEVDAALARMNFAEFKERYKRLIPYMTYYVANNNVNSQVSIGAQTEQRGYNRGNVPPTRPLTRKPQRLASVDRPSDPRSKSNGRGASNGAVDTSRKQEARFVPSVQYDPRDVGGDTDYFAPIRYNTKLNYDTMEHDGSELPSQYREYERPQPRPIVHSQLTRPTSGILRHDTRYQLSPIPDRPSSRPYDSLYERKYLPHESNRPVEDFHRDYLLEYGTRTFNDGAPIVETDHSYIPDSLEPVGYVTIKPSARQHSKPTRILAQSVPRRPLLQASQSIYTAVNNPTASLNDIIKSFQLTDRLPEILDKNNVDSSIKTLVEILGILNNPKQLDYTRLPITNVPSHRNAQSYNSFSQIHKQPKVVTETRFQATPSPLIIPYEQRTFDYKPETMYYTSNEQKIRLEPNHEIVNDERHENVIEYYAPSFHDIDEQKINATYKGMERPSKLEKQTKHGYNMNDDFADNEEEEEEEKYDLTITTETPFSKYQLPDGASTNEQLLPPMTLEYGATRGKPNVDYPAHAAIPETQFSCKEQRYKGFFGDPSTGCQVWHYCDLNGGKSSFLCPNGTIFSQVALTCDWWFNVKCESTTQLYVLNERLYKYILPVMPKFPEDFSGPEVDRYLELKFKEMEDKLKEKKLKKLQDKDKIKEKLQSLESE